MGQAGVCKPLYTNFTCSSRAQARVGLKLKGQTVTWVTGIGRYNNLGQTAHPGLDYWFQGTEASAPNEISQGLSNLTGDGELAFRFGIEPISWNPFCSAWAPCGRLDVLGKYCKRIGGLRSSWKVSHKVKFPVLAENGTHLERRYM